MVATISLLVLVALVCLGLLSLSSLSLRGGQQAEAQARAQANARMALMMALGELQKTMGPDQRVSANASITEPSGSPLANRNWLGAWKTTLTSAGQEWPLIGKKSDAAPSNEPYAQAFIYSDLRNTSANWKTTQRLEWLVSNPNPTQALDAATSLTPGSAAVRMVGKGTLGTGSQEFVNVPLVTVDRASKQSGSYGWWISDNNQKASLNLSARGQNNTNLATAQKDDPSGVAPAYQGFYKNDDGAFYDKLDKLKTYRTVELTGLDANQLKKNFHDFTTDASGLFVDTINGGLRKDLTPLLLTGNATASLNFPAPNTDWLRPFSSKSPIIPGRKHAMVGPSFDMLRSWAQMKNLSGLASGRVDARMAPLVNGNSALRLKPVNSSTERWTNGITDGYNFRWDTWAQDAPRFQPVMTEARWHYYFGYTGSGATMNICTHLIPRVCLWNPYNVSMRVPTTVVLMVNPYWERGGNYDFTADSTSLNWIKQQTKYQAAGIASWNGTIQISGVQNNAAKQGLFPIARYLGFTLEAAEIPPGECLVYSPKPSVNLRTFGNVKIGAYDQANIGNNVLSAASEQGKDHFYLDLVNPEITLSGIGVVNRTSPTWNTLFSDLSTVAPGLGISKYKANTTYWDVMPFALKAVNGGSLSTNVNTIANSTNFPTLQLINCAVGGADSYDFWDYFMPDSQTGSGGTFTRLDTFEAVGPKNPPRCHMYGAKLQWLDESAHESITYAVRQTHWSDPNGRHTVFNPAPIVNWNVRPYYVSRSPASFVSEEWDVTSMGSWLLQHNPSAPQSQDDMPTASSNGYYAKAALGKSAAFSGSSGGALAMPLFDLPNPNFGVLSLASLRHAQLSPFSWAPSYIVGSSMADAHAPTDLSGNEDVAIPLSNIPLASTYPTRWDVLLGKSGGDASPTATMSSQGYGTRTWRISSAGILQQGAFAPPLGAVKVEGQDVDVSDEILAYDIAFEVNQNLWDSFYLSSLPLQGSDLRWTPSSGERLWNTRYGLNRSTREDVAQIEQKINSASDGPAFAFWNSAAFIKNFGSFNVNSTSVDAWISVLSGMRSYERQTASSKAGGSGLTVFSRFFKPTSATRGQGAAANEPDAWSGAREMNDSEIRQLAEQIVTVVKQRGPFISIADFINRRLETADSPRSRMGVLDEAILNGGFNTKFNSGPYALSQANRVFRSDARKQSWKPGSGGRSPDRTPEAKAWGASGFLTQGDILESIGSTLSARGDTFTIRGYGEAKDARGQVMARAMVEATVTRSPEFVSPASVFETNRANKTSPSAPNRSTDPVMSVKRFDAGLDSPVISEVNKKFGRKFQLVSLRWLNAEEI